MDIKKLYESYGTYVVEQRGVISKDVSARLLQYLDVDEIRQIVTDATNDTEDGEKQNGEITKKEAKFINGDDILKFEIDKTNMSDIKITAFVYNPEKTSVRIDFETAAFFLNDAIDGVGTDEDLVARVGTAMALLSDEDGADTGEYFNKLDQQYISTYGESITDAITGDFEGNAEALALNIFRREIEKSTMRGTNMTSIIADIGLTIGTFGGYSAAYKSARLAGVASKLTKLKPLGTGIKAMVQRLPGFGKLTKASKAAAIGKNVKVGQTVPHVVGKSGTFAGTPIKCEVMFIKNGKITLKPLEKLPNGKLAPTFTKNLSSFVKGSSPKLANKILTSAKLPPNAALAALTAKKVNDIGAGATFTEVMGWYDTVTADPESFIQSIEGQGLKGLAMKMKNLADGITSRGDELAMALIVTSLKPSAVKKLNSEYEKISTDGSSMLKDLEYESSYFGMIDTDLTDLISIYVKGVLKQDAEVTNMYNKLNKS